MAIAEGRDTIEVSRRKEIQQRLDELTVQLVDEIEDDPDCERFDDREPLWMEQHELMSELDTLA